MVYSAARCSLFATHCARIRERGSKLSGAVIDPGQGVLSRNEASQEIQVLDILVHIFSLWRFDNLRNIKNPLIRHNHTESLFTNTPFTDVFVAVDVRAESRFRVVQVKEPQF